MAIDKQVFRSGPYADFIAQAVRVDGVLYNYQPFSQWRRDDCSESWSPRSRQLFLCC